jgi:hypothetical protein
MHDVLCTEVGRRPIGGAVLLEPLSWRNIYNINSGVKRGKLLV